MAEKVINFNCAKCRFHSQWNYELIVKTMSCN